MLTNLMLGFFEDCQLIDFVDAELSQILDGVIEEHDWARFDAYAKRVRHLIWVDDDNFDSSIFLRIAQLRNKAPLLPFLVSLRAAPYRGHGLLSLLSPSLRRVDFYPQSSHDLFPMVWTCLEALTTIVPNLKELRIQTTLSNSSLLSISRMYNLQTLLLFCQGFEDLEFFRALSSFHHLKRLDILFEDTATTISSLRWPIPQPSTTPFPALEYLNLTLLPKHLSLLLVQLKRDGLKSLEINTSKPPLERLGDANHWALSFINMQQMFPSSLQELHLTYDLIYSREHTVTSPPQFHIFEPLLEIRSLKSVTICDFPWTSFSDEEFHKIAVSWKDIEELCFYHRSGQTTNATFQSLQSFAKFCPKLHTLAIAFNTEPLPPLEEIDVLSHSLRVLFIESQLPSDVFGVIRNLDHLFPSLARIVPTTPFIESTLKDLKAARHDQKARDSMVT